MYCRSCSYRCFKYFPKALNVKAGKYPFQFMKISFNLFVRVFGVFLVRIFPHSD